MNATQMTKEQISAWLDGEMPDADVEAMLAALCQDEGRACWDQYHQIGDVLRSDELAMQPGADFAAKMAARLAQEPAYLLPVAAPERQNLRHMLRHKAWPGVAIAAGLMVVLALPYSSLGPQDQAPGLAKRNTPTDSGFNLVAAGKASSPQLRQKPVQDGEILRDPQIQQYLEAHQRYSPSVYSAAKYVRPVEANKTGTDK